MKRFNEILCVVTTPELSRATLDRAVTLSENNQARLTAVAVAEPISIGMGMPNQGPISAELQAQRLSLTRNGQVRYQLKTPYTDGTTHVLFEPLDFISRLVALVPKPRVNLTRFHGVFAPNSKYRALCPCRRLLRCR